MTTNVDTQQADMTRNSGTGYKIVVRGELDSRYAVLFDGMKIECVEGRTVLTGRVLDQSQLHGFTRRLFELGHELLSLEASPQPASERGETTETRDSGPRRPPQPLG